MTAKNQTNEAVDRTTFTELDPILKVRGASVTFSMDRGTSRVMNDVDMDIQQEEILGIVGESGSGKSMFASALLNAVVDPGEVAGKVTYRYEDGTTTDITQLEYDELRELRWEEISMVFQGAMSSFNPTMDLRGHFQETLVAHDYDIESGMEHARELLTDLHLEPDRILDSYPHELSGGMQQRALIALSLLLKPNVLVMDEPTAALDLLMQRSILTLLESLKEKYNLTVVFITHDLPLAVDIADRLAVMYAFEFAEVGPAKDLIENPTHPYTRALLKSVPSLEMPLEHMDPIEGASPDPVNVPEGCSYHPRCPLADEQCQQEDPPFHNVTEEHETACFHWKESVDSISLSTEYDAEGDRRRDRDRSADVDQSDDCVVSMTDIEVHFEQSSDGLLNRLLGNTETVQAVDGVNLDIYENDVVALVGESGCGKTTLGKAAIGAQRPTGGSIEYRGQDIWDAKDGAGDVSIPHEDIRRALQIIHQDPGSALNPNRSVQAILSVPLKRWKPEMDANDRQARILSMLKTVGMSPPDDYATRYPHQLSGGEKQRVALIRALLMNPDLILADEAVSALDVSLRVEMMNLMLELQDAFNTSYLFISHDLANARYLAEHADGRIGVMYLGELVEIGPAEEIINDPRHPYTQILRWSTADIDSNTEAEEPPLREVDVPDPVNPPSGCRFQTRCPKAKEICTRESPNLEEGSDEHPTACFREYPDDHPYWKSEPLEGTGFDDEAKEPVNGD